MNKVTQFFSLVLIAIIVIASFLYFGGQKDIEGLKKRLRLRRHFTLKPNLFLRNLIL